MGIVSRHGYNKHEDCEALLNVAVFIVGMEIKHRQAKSALGLRVATVTISMRITRPFQMNVFKKCSS